MSDGYRISFDREALRRLGAAGMGRGRGAQLVEAMARIIRAAIVDEMEGAPPRTGRVYRIPGTQATYTASAPGEAPAVRGGLYRDSWGITDPVIDAQRIVAAVVNPIMVGGVPLGLLLEEGGGHVLPRPHIRPGLERARGEIEALIRRLR